jgi:maleate cis-trans isomerase
VTPPEPPSLGELRALADRARDRLALYRRRVYLGRGRPERLHELEREASGAADRLARARSKR